MVSEASPGLVRPTVRLFFTCDSAVYDLADDRWELKNPWHTVWMRRGVRRKFGVKKLTLYVQVSGGLGDFDISVVLQYLTGKVVLGRSDPQRASFAPDERLVVTELTFDMTDVPFPRPDTYEFRLMAGGEQLEGGSALLRVHPGDLP